MELSANNSRARAERVLRRCDFLRSLILSYANGLLMREQQRRRPVGVANCKFQIVPQSPKVSFSLSLFLSGLPSDIGRASDSTRVQNHLGRIVEREKRADVGSLAATRNKLRVMRVTVEETRIFLDPVIAHRAYHLSRLGYLPAPGISSLFSSSVPYLYFMCKLDLQSGALLLYVLFIYFCFN